MSIVNLPISRSCGEPQDVKREVSKYRYAAVVAIFCGSTVGQFAVSAQSLVRALCIGVSFNIAFAWAQTPVTVVEYYNTDLDAYFITGRANEQALLDSAAGFRRTGMNFASVSALAAPSTLSAICRYYISTQAPFVSSHFYGVQSTDCAQIAALKPAGFSDEGFDFATTLPNANRACPANAPNAIRRAYRAAANGKTGNHRYATSQTTIDGMVALGWVDEGVTFCATTAATIGKSSTQVNFENFLLTGGVYNLQFGSATSGNTTTTSYVLTYQTAATTGPVPGNVGAQINSPIVNVARTLPLPNTATLPRDRVLFPLLRNVFASSVDPARFTVRYVGGNVEFDTLTDDGKQATLTTVASAAENYVLTGTFASVPIDIAAIYPALASSGSVNLNAVWRPGAAYQKRLGTRKADTHFIGDCGATTYDDNVTPCPNSAGKTLESWFPLNDSVQGRTWQLSDGVITNVNGVRIWVANIERPTSASPTISYRTYIQAPDGSGIYIGALQRAGTALRTNTATGIASHQIRFNQAAIDSIRAALNF